MQETFKVGDVVEVVGAPDGNHEQWDYSEGFDNTWITCMNEAIGSICTIKSIDIKGVRMDNRSYSYSYPPKALKKVQKRKNL